MTDQTPRTDALWTFDYNTNTVRDADGALVANLRYTLDGERIVGLARENAALRAALESIAADRAVYVPELQAIARAALA